MLLLSAILAGFVLSVAAADAPKPEAVKKDTLKSKKPAEKMQAKKDTAKPADKPKAKDAVKASAPVKVVKEAPKAAPASKPTLPTGPVPGDAIDFVYMADLRPLFVRLHVQVDGKSVEEAWQDSIKELFKYLDRNGDGVLSKEEAEKTPPPQLLLNANALYGGTFAASMSQLDSNRDGKVTLQELSDYYRRNGGGPFHFRSGQAQQVAYDVYGRPQNQGNLAEQLNEALFGLLDTNKDGKLSRDELAAAEKILLTMDEDEDDMVTIDELLPNRNRNASPFVQRRGVVTPAGATNPDFVMLSASEPSGKLARQLLAKYGGKATTLTRKQIGLDQAAFDELDLDKNGELDARELDRFARRGPDLEFMVRHGKGRGTGPVESLPRKSKPDPLAASLKSSKSGYFLDLGTTRLELRTSARNGMYFASAANVRSIYVMQFKMLDAKNKGYLEQKDVRQNPYLSNSFKMMDRDNDGKLTEKEMLEWIEKITALQNKATASCASLAISDQGRGLFDLIDASHDSRLSVREMRNAVKLVEQLDRDGDGHISRAEIPRNLLLAMDHGPGSDNQNSAPVVFNPYGMNQQNMPTLSAGPLWFRKMDRNRDGDVSRKEFLGTDEEFDRIDTDHDGLISLQEAESFDRLMRAQKVATKSK
jgi:Ca2+-binding EF-hand superfamily protein